MIKVENIETSGWEAALRGMRNPLNSHDRSDSTPPFLAEDGQFHIGQNDLDLALRLIKAGTEHRKFLRMIHVSMDITAPLYWWKEADTYKISTTANSCSSMHKIAAKEFTLGDFSHDRLLVVEKLQTIVDWLNEYRTIYIKWDDSVKYQDSNGVPLNKKDIWWQMIQLLPSSYNQRRTWDASLETILSIMHQRKGHKLDEWETFRQVCFNEIPYLEVFYKALYGKEDK